MLPVKQFYYFFFFGAGDWTLGLLNVRQALYHSTTTTFTGLFILRQGLVKLFRLRSNLQPSYVGLWRSWDNDVHLCTWQQFCF